MCTTTTRAWLLALMFAGAATTLGCSGGGRYPVTGRVAYEDGTPLTEGTVIAEMDDDEVKVMAQGDVRPDGTFTWGTLQPGDGARPGKYRVAVLPRALGDSEIAQGKKPAVDKKFTRFETSGIEFEVTKGSNTLTITVTKSHSGDS